MTMPSFVHTQSDHDETAIARLAADDLSEHEADAARLLTATCPACAELHADLRSIMAATAGLPAPRRTRDFQLTHADAARLRRTSWRRLLGRFGDQRLAFTRPLATGLVTLGIAGLVFAAAPFMPGSASAAPTNATPAGAVAGSLPGSSPADLKAYLAASPAASTSMATSAPAAASAAASAAATSVVPPAASQIPVAAESAIPSGSPEEFGAHAPATGSPAPPAPQADNFSTNQSAGGLPPAASGPSGLLLGSIALLVLGMSLFALRWVARRTN